MNYEQGTNEYKEVNSYRLQLRKGRGKRVSDHEQRAGSEEHGPVSSVVRVLA